MESCIPSSVTAIANLKSNKISLHKEHKAGEEMEVDWAGDHISYVKPGTGEIMAASLFVAVLPASAYPFCVCL